VVQVFQKFGRNLSIIDNVGRKNVSLFSWPKTFRTTGKFKNIKTVYSDLICKLDNTDGYFRTLNKLQDMCEFKGYEVTKGLKLHHLNPMVSVKCTNFLSVSKIIFAKRRKTVVSICKKHHAEMHNCKLLKQIK
jgi:hypothetical protein